MAYSYVQYTADGTTANFTFPFGYLSKDHIKVTVQGADAVFSFLNDNTVKVEPTPFEAQIVEIRRVTPKDTLLVNFNDGSVLLERDLDLMNLFNLYVAQEAYDLSSDTIGKNSIGQWDAKGLRLGNLADPVLEGDAVPKGKLDYEYPAVATVSQFTSQVNIVASDLGATTGFATDLGLITDSSSTSPPSGTSAIKTVADHITDVQNVSTHMTDVQGAITSAANAASSATAAAASATAASTSATNAATSAASALSSKNAAATSETNAQTSANNAATSATTASGQATAASGSATAAATSASNAATSAVAAASSASSASTSASNASSSATSAASSASSASASAATATTKASDATTSASNAAASATAAASSASSASASATTATSQAAIATTKAADATTQATNAATSASTATTQATNAASSATAAAASATDAAASAASAAALLDNFDDRYLGPKASAPTLDNDGMALLVGALYFDTTSGKMRVYTATGWVDASSAAQAALTKYKFVATAGQTTFSGVDVNGLTLSYFAGGEVVSLNGSVQVGGGDDYTASNGTSVVLTSGAAAGDTLEVYAFASFSIASFNGSAIVDGTITTAKYLDQSVTTGKIADGAITEAKFASTFDLGVLP